VHVIRSWHWEEIWVIFWTHLTELGLRIRCSDVINVIVIWRRHIGDIGNVKNDGVKMRKSDNSYAKVIRVFRLSTGAKFHIQNSLQEFVYLWRCTASMLYLQNGGVDYCTQNDVILTTCIRRNITYLRNDKCICSGSLAGSLSEENLRTEPQRIYLCLEKADLRTRRYLKPKKTFTISRTLN